jgi:hypothetical protein
VPVTLRLVAEADLDALRFLLVAGFTQTGVETLFAAGIGRDVVERIYTLAR